MKKSVAQAITLIAIFISVLRISFSSVTPVVENENDTRRNGCKRSSTRGRQEEGEHDCGKEEQDHLEDSGYDNKQHPKIVSAEHPVLHAVLHIGPHKTGTTTIQEISRQLVGTIVQDGYDMPWNHMDDKTHLRLIQNQVQFTTCFIDASSAYNRIYPCTSKELLQSARDIAKQNHSLLISSETLSQNVTGLSKLAEFLTPWEHVTIVVSYRHFYDWILSYHNSMTKRLGSWENCKDKFKANTTDDKLRPSIYDHLTSTSLMNHQEKRSFSNLLTRYSQYFDNIEVMNIHDEETELAVQFYCNAISDAPNTCNTVKEMLSSPSSKVTANKGVPLAYEDITYAAHRRGLINIQTPEQYKQIKAAAQNYHENTLKQSRSDFPLNCPSKDALDKLWNVSIEADKSYYAAVAKSMGESGEYTAAHEKKLWDDFKVKTKTGSCELNMTALLELQVWKDFFNSL